MVETLIVDVQLQHLEAPLDKSHKYIPRALLPDAKDFQVLDDIVGQQILADVPDNDGFSADRASLLGLPPLLQATEAEGMTRFRKRYPQKRRVGSWNTSKQMMHFKVLEMELGFLKLREDLSIEEIASRRFIDVYNSHFSQRS